MQNLTQTELFTSISADLSYWLTKLDHDVVVVRLLSYEFTPKAFEELDYDSYLELMSEYKNAIEHIVRSGNIGEAEYWDVSVLGRTGEPSVDHVTSYALRALYLPTEWDPMNPEIESNSAVNTSLLGLTPNPMQDGLFLIGKHPVLAGEASILERLSSVDCKVGYTKTFESKNRTFRTRWLPRDCRKVLSKKRLDELSLSCRDLWSSLPNPAVLVPEAHPIGSESVAME